MRCSKLQLPGELVVKVGVGNPNNWIVLPAVGKDVSDLLKPRLAEAYVASRVAIL